MKKLTQDNFNYQYSGDSRHWNWEVAHAPRYTNPWTEKEAKQVRDDILTNQKLREYIVDVADLWDGKESSHYGNRLLHILKSLGINDVPEFYKKENIDKFIADMRDGVL